MEDKFEKNQVNEKEAEIQNQSKEGNNDPILNKDVLKEYLGIQEKEKSSSFKDRIDFQLGQIKESIANNVTLQEWKYFWTLKKIAFVIGGILLVFLAIYLFALFDIQKSVTASQYRLVPEKISRSAVIRISLPAGTEAEEAKKVIDFNPKIEGNWVNNKSSYLEVFAEDNNKIIYYKPNAPLNVDRYYQVSLNLGEDKSIKADFLAVEDPVIEAVFPDNSEEAMEDAKITIAFNRPMVSFENKEDLNPSNVPIEITPEIQGKYTWISPSILQLKPDSKLISSANYKVKINEGFTSVDGIDVKGGEFYFKTRTLKYLGVNQEERTIVYNQPIRIYFNQEVDIKKIASEITLYGNGKKIPFYIGYAENDDSSKEINNGIGLELGNLDDLIESTINSLNINSIGESIGTLVSGDYSIDTNTANKSGNIIEIYNKSNSDKIWDLGTKYSLTINKAYPIKGDISLEEKKEFNFSAVNIVKSISSYSDRTNYSSVNMFDPQGYVIINFYEDIDINKSIVEASTGIAKIEYGEKCSGENKDINSCLKLADKKQLRVYFDSNKVAANSKINLILSSIVGLGGRKINSSNIVYSISVYKTLDLKIGKDINKNNFNSLILCSNNPLIVPSKDDFKKFIASNQDYEIFSWNTSWLNNYYNDNYCPIGYFVTVLEVGLTPETNYSFGFSIEDVFGQKGEKSMSVNTDKPSDSYVSIFSMQKDYSITSPEKTSISFGAKNIDQVDLEICKKYDAYSFYDAYLKNDFSFSNCEKVRKETIKLSSKKWINQYFNVDIKTYFDEPIGNYIIKISNSQYKGKDGGNSIYSFVTVTNLAVAERRVDLTDSNAEQNSNIFGEIKNIYWITDSKTQKPIDGAKVKIYASGKIVEGESNEEGLAFVTPVPGFDVIIIEYGRDSTAIAKDDNLNDVSRAYSVKKSYIYTDKVLYKLGETVNIRGIFRLGYDSNYKMPDNAINISIYNPKGEEISKQSVTLAGFGTFNNYFKIDNDAPLGNYLICAADYNCSNFEVLENNSQAFEIKVSPTKEEYVSKEKIQLDINAQYYFGVPVENGEVEYTVSAQDYYFDKYEKGNFNFINEENEQQQEMIFAEGKTTLDIYGKGSIIENIDIEKVFKNSARSKILFFDITVKSSFGQSVRYRKSVILHQGEFYLGSLINPYFVKKGQRLSFQVKSVDINGKAILVNNIDAKIYKIEWVHAKKQNSDGTSSYFWEKKRNLVKNIKFSTNKNGEYSKSKEVIDIEGEYEFDFAAVDKYGNNVSSSIFFYVFGEKQIEVRAQDDLDLTLKAIKEDISLEEDGRLIIESPYPEAKALITIERGRIFEYKIVDIVGGVYDYVFEPKGVYFPNVYVSVLLQGPNSEVRFATKEYTIKSGTSNLKIDLTTEDSYLPGEEVSVRVVTRDGNLVPTPAEVSLAVVSNDLSIEKKDADKDPFSYFYNGFPLTVSAYSNMKNLITEKKVKTGDKNNYSSNISFESNEFKTVAFWTGTVQTNNDGYANVVFRLPDTLGNWRIEALGINAKSNVGVAYTEFTTKKELMISSLKPAFIIPGDTFYVGAQVFNQTDKKKTANASFKSDTLEFLGSNQDTLLNIEPGGSQIVYFYVKAPLGFTKGEHSFKISADLQDSESLVSCEAKKDDSLVRGRCGSADGGKAFSIPTDNLCSSGIPTEVSGDGPWTWNCEGINGGSSASCKSSKNSSATNGQCGSASGKKTAYAPNQKLCSIGIPSEVLGFGRWTWTCEGVNGGKSASCSAVRDETLINGQCGSANKKLAKEVPSENLCSSGNASPVTSSWAWTCNGANGGADDECGAKKSNEANNKCGLANGEKFYFAPSEDLCLIGSPSEVVGEGPWTWTCGDTHAFVDEKIDIRENTTYENTFLSGSTIENEKNEIVFISENVSMEKGELSIKASPNLSVFLSNALNYLVNYPYFSSDQIANKLKAMIVAGQGLNIMSIFEKFKLEKNNGQSSDYGLSQEITQGLAKLYRNQNYDGGFSIWGSSKSDLGISLSVLDSLFVLNEHEKITDDDVNLTNLIDYVYNNSFKDQKLKDSPNELISSAYILTQSGKYKNDSGIKQEMERIIKDDSLIKDKLSNQSLLKLSIMVNKGGFSLGMDSKLNKLLEGKVATDAKGAFIERNKDNNIVSNYETTINDTALYLKSIAIKKSNTSNNEKIIQWLINSRFKDGSWGSTKDTVEVIDAFVSYLNWKKEKDSNYELVISVNGERADSYSFDSGKLFDQISKKIEISKLKKPDYNTITLDKSKHRALFKDTLYYDLSFKHYLLSEAKPQDEGFSITRALYSLDDKENSNPFSYVGMGNIVKVHLEVVIPKEGKMVMIEDFIPAGMEVVDIDLATEQNYLRNIEKGVKNDYFYPDFKEIRDDRIFLYKDYVPAGVYHFDYYARAATKGTYSYLPAVISEIYNPQRFGKTNSSMIEIK